MLEWHPAKDVKLHEDARRNYVGEELIRTVRFMTANI
jgi:hypothetical protein